MKYQKTKQTLNFVHLLRLNHKILFKKNQKHDFMCLFATDFASITIVYREYEN
jgi:hypothetical protein